MRQWGLFGPEMSLEGEGVGEALAGAARHRPTAVVPPEALAAAVADAGGRVRVADARFSAWFGDEIDSPAVLTLLRQGQQRGLALGLSEAADGGVLAVCAGRREAFARWVLPPDQQALLDRAGEALFVVAFAPSRCSELALRASSGFGLSELEARVAEAMLGAPSLRIAAAQIGVAFGTARDALNNAMRKTGADGASALVRRMTALMCAAPPTDEHQADPDGDAALMARAMGLTPAEAKIAAQMEAGRTAAELGQAVGSSEQTVKSHLKAIFRKTGVRRNRDLERLVADLRELDRMTRSGGVVTSPPSPDGSLRVIAVAGGRQVAYLDYGPSAGRPLFVGHGLFSGRSLPPAFVALLQGAGFRPLVQQRPGFGLSHAAPSGQYLATAADDTAAMLDALKRPQGDAIGRDCGAPSLLAFGARHPERLGHGMLLNARAPAEADYPHPMPMAGLSRLFLRRPDLLMPLSEALRRRLTYETVERAMTKVLYSPSDLAAVRLPEVRDRLKADVMALIAQTSAGPIHEQAVYPDGWRVPDRVGGERWTIVTCDELEPRAPDPLWAGLPGVTYRRIPVGGFLTPFTHPEALVQLLSP